MQQRIENRKARFEFEIVETYEAGIELLGPETRSIRLGRADLSGAYIIVRGGEVFLVNMRITSTQPNNPSAEFDEMRNRRLLLNKSEIRRIAAALDRDGLTAIPLTIFQNKHRFKVELAVATRRKTHDKRQLLKKRDDERDMRRATKR